MLLSRPDSCGSSAGTVIGLRSLSPLTHSSMRLSPADGTKFSTSDTLTLASSGLRAQQESIEGADLGELGVCTGSERTSVIVHIVHAPMSRVGADVNDLRRVCTARRALFTLELFTLYRVHCIIMTMVAGSQQHGSGHTFCVVIRGFTDDAGANRKRLNLQKHV